MNTQEAKRILEDDLTSYCECGYAELRRKVESGQVDTHEIQGASGVDYQLEIQYFWDSKPGATIRVIGSIDDGGIRAFFPVTNSFLIHPAGEAVE